MSLSPIAAPRANGSSYDASRLFGAREAFESGDGFLFNTQPRILTLAAPPIRLELPGLVDFEPPDAMPERFPGQKKSRKKRPLRAFNPSIAHAPAGLCPRCKWAVSLRIDQLHQCDGQSPFQSAGEELHMTEWFQGTAIAIFDARLNLLGWTWMLNAPSYQIAVNGVDDATLRATGCASVGNSTDNFMPPPFAKQTYDARLLAYDGELLTTYACSSCVFSLSTLRVTAVTTSDGGLTKLRAWANMRLTYQAAHFSWLAGRNQALFLHPPRASASGRPVSLLVQPRLGMVGDLGRPKFHRPREGTTCWTKRAKRTPPAAEQFAGGAASASTAASTAAVQVAERGPVVANCRSGVRRSAECGTWPDGSVVSQPTLIGVQPSKARLEANATAELGEWLKASGTFGGLSLTSNLIPISRRCAGGSSAGGKATGGKGIGADGSICRGYLGIGHLHRGEGASNRHLFRRRQEGPLPWKGVKGLRRKQPFAFGFRYTHFFYVLEPRPPFAVLGASPEFCIAAAQDADDCESVQFVSGLALDKNASSGALRGDQSPRTGPNTSLLLSYGVNDCEARLGTLKMDTVWAMLRTRDDAIRQAQALAGL